MKRYVRIDDNSVVEVIELSDDIAIADAFHPDLASAFRLSSEADLGWLVEGDSLVAPPAPPVPPIDLAAYAADRRWRVEVGGMSFAGIVVATDGESQVKVLGARVAADADPEFTTPWFGRDGVSVTLDATAIVALSNAMLAHVQSGFVIREQVLQQIEAGTITTTTEIDAEFLP